MKCDGFDTRRFSRSAMRFCFALAMLREQTKEASVQIARLAAALEFFRNKKD
jgi:hypothetical protein